MAEEHDEKKTEGTVELSVGDLEEVSGGFVIETDDGRYVTKDEINGEIYYIGDSLDRAREVAMERDISTMVMAQSEYERRSGKKIF